MKPPNRFNRKHWGVAIPPGEGYEIAVPLMACVVVIVACLVLDVTPLIWWWWKGWR